MYWHFVFAADFALLAKQSPTARISRPASEQDHRTSKKEAESKGLLGHS